MKDFMSSFGGNDFVFGAILLSSISIVGMVLHKRVIGTKHALLQFFAISIVIICVQIYFWSLFDRQILWLFPLMYIPTALTYFTLTNALKISASIYAYIFVHLIAAFLDLKLESLGSWSFFS